MTYEIVITVQADADLRVMLLTIIWCFIFQIKMQEL